MENAEAMSDEIVMEIASIMAAPAIEALLSDRVAERTAALYIETYKLIESAVPA